MRSRFTLASLLGVAIVIAMPASAQTPFHFSTNDPDGLIATGARIPTPGKIQIETGDDFVLSAPTTFLNHATFTGLLIGGATVGDISNVNVDLYHVFPKDSDTTRTITVPTRANSPADTEFDGRNFLDGTLGFTTNVLNSNFTAANSVLNGIHPAPDQNTHGDGAVTGTEVQFSVDFTTPFDLPADHYFFVPTVSVNGDGNFLWLSAAKPIVAPGTPFPPGFTDLQSWVRNADLDPDWLRVGADIVGGTAFNASFSLDGTAVPEPGTLALLLGAGLSGSTVAFRRLRRR
jgi:hypothetical protein